MSSHGGNAGGPESQVAPGLLPDEERSGPSASPIADSALASAVRVWMATVYGAVSDEQLDFICNTGSYFTLQEALARNDSSGSDAAK